MANSGSEVWLMKYCDSMVVSSIPDRRTIGQLIGTGMGGNTTSVCNQPPRPTQPRTLCGTRNKYRPKYGDALRMEIKAGWLIPLVDKRVILLRCAILTKVMGSCFEPSLYVGNEYDRHVWIMNKVKV